LLPLAELQQELDALESGSFLQLTDEELLQKLRFLHGGFGGFAPVLPVGTVIYRAVLVNKRPSSASEISYPPRERVKVNGRLNKAGEVMFYGALDQFRSCLFECKAQVGQTFAVSRWQTKEKIKVNHLGYSQIVFDQAAAGRPLPDYVDPGGYGERNLAICNWQARVFTADVGVGKEERYRLPIGLKSLAIGVGGPTDHNPYSGIQYPSIASQLRKDNIALFPWEVDRKLELSEVTLLTVDSPAAYPSTGPSPSGEFDVRQLDSAHPDGKGKLVWGVE
jgi:hypothetical protein